MRWALAALLVGCGHAAPAPSGPALKVLPGELDSMALLSPTAARAAKGGAGSLALVTKGLLREGDRAGAFVEKTTRDPKGCLFLFARGAASVTDVDLSVFSDDGEPLAQDEEPDATPAIVLCPPYPARVYVSTRAAAGEGLVAVGVQRIALAAAEGVRRAMAARGTQGAVNHRVDQWPELERAAATELAALGPGAREVRRAGLAGDRSITTSLTETVPARSCASLVLLPEASLQALDVELEDETGALLMRTSRPAEDRAGLRFCTDTARTLTASFRPHVGRGLVGAVWFRAPREPSDARVLSGSGKQGKAWLDEEVKRLRGERESRGAKRVRDERFVVKPSALVARTVDDLQPSACHVVTALVGARNAHVSLSLLTPEGRTLGTREGGSRASVVVCGMRSVRAAVSVREAQGEGRLEVERLARPVDGAAMPFAASRVATLLDELDATPDQSSPIAGVLDLPVPEVPKGRCVLVAAASEHGPGARLDVTEGGEPLLTRGDGEVRWLRVCADTAPRRLKVLATSASGVASWSLLP